MSYTEPLINQIYRFMLSVGFGIIMGLLYEVLTFIFTSLFYSKRSALLRDVIFSIVFTIMSFFFMLVYNEGEIRLNIIFGQISGVVIFHLTFGKYVLFPVKCFFVNKRFILSKKKNKKNKK